MVESGEGEGRWGKKLKVKEKNEELGKKNQKWKEKRRKIT